MSLGDTVKMLAVLRPDEKEAMAFLERYEPWVIQFQLVPDDKPASWLGRKCFSVLEILRCVSPDCRRILERTPFFNASAASIARLEGLLSKERPTAIVFGNFDVRLYPLVLPLLQWRRPYGIIAHGCEICPLPNNKTNDFVIKQTMLKGASWIAANSHHTKSLLDVWRIPAERIKVVHPPISEEAIRESALLEPTSRKDDDLSLVTICRLVKGKGIDLVLRALKVLTARGIPYRYVIGGDGPEKGRLEALVDELGLQDKVHFRGSVEGQEKWRLLRNADLFVMPSRYDPAFPWPWRESFGIAFAEAAAFGVPAVGSRSGGIPDAVIDGETGILVPEESPQDLADALTLLYQKPEIRNQMGGAARERARRQFSPKTIAARFREEFLTRSHNDLQQKG
jgi:glycosyltransferase involved in cell wall biosynthesis